MMTKNVAFWKQLCSFEKFVSTEAPHPPDLQNVFGWGQSEEQRLNSMVLLKARVLNWLIADGMS